MDQWYFSDSGQQRGPMTAGEIQSLLESSKINDETLVWTDGMAEWKPVGTISEFHISPYAPPASSVASEVDWSGYVPSGPQVRPWVRYWARTFDFLLVCVIGGGLAVALWPRINDMNDKVFGLLLLFCYNFVEPAMLATMGTTPFKALLRVRVRNNDGTKPNYAKGLRRTFSVWLRGQGLGIPLVALFTSITSYTRLTKNGNTSWDQDGGFTVSHRTVTWWRWLLLILLFAGFIGLVILGSKA